jgi:hypothetical protein
MSFFALLSTNVDYTKPLGSVADKLALGGQMLAMGIGIVFSVLLLIWISLEIFHYLFATLPEKMKAKGTGAASAPKEPKPEKPKKVKPAPVAPAAAPVADTELIAVITAAIAASENAPVGSFRVVSFRRV